MHPMFSVPIDNESNRNWNWHFKSTLLGILFQVDRKSHYVIVILKCIPQIFSGLYIIRTESMVFEYNRGTY